nr:hypothetical protein [Tanacetum cinerariifolium]
MVTKEEVKKAVWDCGSNKSPGPNEDPSFSMVALQRSSNSLKGLNKASGLRINMCKSKIMGVNVEDGKI